MMKYPKKNMKRKNLITKKNLYFHRSYKKGKEEKQVTSGRTKMKRGNSKFQL
jgi:hypothetical protein